MVKIPKEEYERLKIEARLTNIDTELLIQLMEGLRDIKEGI